MEIGKDIKVRNNPDVLCTNFKISFEFDDPRSPVSRMILFPLTPNFLNGTGTELSCNPF